MIYLDNAATTPVDPLVAEEIKIWITKNYGNPSSVYKIGQEAKIMIEDTRDQFAEFIGASPSEIYFTSGGTEANNFAIKGAFFANINNKNHIITSPIEHSSILDSVNYLKQRFKAEISFLSVNKYGEINHNELNNVIKDNTLLISIMHSNNELGIINNIKNISEISARKKILFHSDMVQSLGKINFNIKELGVNFASFSAHKIYGPKGLGVLYISKNSSIDKYIHGGKQERDRRGGTENVPAIAGFKKAIEILKNQMNNDIEHYKMLRSYFLKNLISGFSNIITLNSITDEHSKNYLFNIINLTLTNTKNLDADSIIIKLGMNNIAVSSGSACTSGSIKPSHVLKAIGYNDNLAKLSIRISFGRFNSVNDIDVFLSVLKKILV